MAQPQPAGQIGQDLAGRQDRAVPMDGAGRLPGSLAAMSGSIRTGPVPQRDGESLEQPPAARLGRRRAGSSPSPCAVERDTADALHAQEPAPGSDRAGIPTPGPRTR